MTGHIDYYVLIETANTGEKKMKEIKQIVANHPAALSAKGIAELAKIDPTSEALRDIEYECWVMVGKGEMVAYDRRDECMGLFFDA